jgi:Glu-tRNA(Gln) amidotransferase subunit E-like FAD-binding protein
LISIGVPDRLLTLHRTIVRRSSGARIIAGLSISEAARRLGRTHDQVRGAIDALGIPTVRIGSAWVLSERDFLVLVERLRRRPVAERA